MNEKLVANINAKVGHDDTLIHVGDWSFGGFENIMAFRSRIVCQNIILILGNHDHHIKKNKDNIKELFTHVSKMEEVSISKQTISLCHFPMESWIDDKKGTLMIHGHLHNKGEKRFGKGKKMDIGIDGSPDFSPYHIDEVFAILDKRQIHAEERH